MKKDFNTPVLSLDGKEITREGKPFLISHAIAEALLGQDPREQVSGEQKYKCFCLALRFGAEGEIEISTEEAALIKERVGRIYPPLTVGRIYEFIEN